MGHMPQVPGFVQYPAVWNRRVSLISNEQLQGYSPLVCISNEFQVCAHMDHMPTSLHTLGGFMSLQVIASPSQDVLNSKPQQHSGTNSIAMHSLLAWSAPLGALAALLP